MPKPKPRPELKKQPVSGWRYEQRQKDLKAQEIAHLQEKTNPKKIVYMLKN